MAVELGRERAENSRPIHLLRSSEEAILAPQERRWLEEVGYKPDAGKFLLLPSADGGIGGAVLGLGAEQGAAAALLLGVLGRDLPEGAWHFAKEPPSADLATLAVLLGAYRFTRYGKKDDKTIRLTLPEGVEESRTRSMADSISLVRDLVNTPAADMGPAALEGAVRDLAKRHDAEISVISGDDLLTANFPMIHAVGRAAAQAPRLIDLRWGREDAPRVTLVGKGVCFDTGGLDIKPSSSMLLMKKDMGGAANVLGLASMIMDRGLDLRLRVLIPAVENSISASSFRPGDILQSRKGLTVEVGNTDAEGRLVLADALALADEEKPDLLIDMATLTGAARVALGPDLPPFFTRSDELAAKLADLSTARADPMWRLPLWKPYEEDLESKVADTNNVSQGGMAGAITAALFLEKFVEKAANWVHFDVYGWNPRSRPHSPVGGEAQCIRSLFSLLEQQYA